MRGHRQFVLVCLSSSSSTARGLFFHTISSSTSSIARKTSVHQLRTTTTATSTSLNMSSSSSEQISSKNDGETSWRSLLEITMAKTRKIRGSNYVQLSTVTQTGEPRCRTLVFRGFITFPTNHIWYNICPAENKEEGLSCSMKLCTDARSQKVEDVSYQSISELVWWFPTTSEQYRIRGIVRLVGDKGNCSSNNGDDDGINDKDKLVLEQERKQLWGNLSDPARESFLQDPTIVPGEAYISPDSSATTSSPPPVGGRDSEGKVVPPPSNFLLVVFDPNHVDYLRLSGGQYRQIDSLLVDDNEDDGEVSSPTRTRKWSFQRVNP